MPAKPHIFDTSIYIRELRNGNADILLQTQSENSPLWLSAVVLEELYVGASDKQTVKILTKIENNFDKINRLLVPNQTDWSIAGQILNKIGEKYGFDKVGKARLTNDTLLAASVARNGLKLFTANAKDFRLISEFREFDWEVV
jgi:predicted nucleic acid-binding protein